MSTCFCSDSDIIFPSTLLRLELGNKSEARLSVVGSNMVKVESIVVVAGIILAASISIVVAEEIIVVVAAHG